MAVPPIVIRLAAAAATDKRTWEVVAMLIAAVIAPIIVIVMMMAALISGAETANKSLIDYSFTGVEIPAEFTEEQRGAIEDMRSWLDELDEIITENADENEEYSLNENMVKAAFYCLNFCEDLDENFDFKLFCECFEDADYSDLETALQGVSEEFSQYETTDNLVSSIGKVYDYLNQKGCN